jgi:hypothetical protein
MGVLLEASICYLAVFTWCEATIYVHNNLASAGETIRFFTGDLKLGTTWWVVGCSRHNAVTSMANSCSC